MSDWNQPVQGWGYSQSMQQYQAAASEGSSGTVGNNPYGSTGTVKCDECRRRRKACVYDLNYPHLPCTHCATDAQKAALCVKKAAPNNQQTPPPQSTTGEHRMRDYVEAYERSYPHATLDQILDYLNTRPWAVQQQPAVQQPMVADNAQNGYIWAGTYGGGVAGNGTSYYLQ